MLQWGLVSALKLIEHVQRRSTHTIITTQNTSVLSRYLYVDKLFVRSTSSSRIMTIGSKRKHYFQYILDLVSCLLSSTWSVQNGLVSSLKKHLIHVSIPHLTISNFNYEHNISTFLNISTFDHLGIFINVTFHYKLLNTYGFVLRLRLMIAFLSSYYLLK